MFWKEAERVGFYGRRTLCAWYLSDLCVLRRPDTVVPASLGPASFHLAQERYCGAISFQELALLDSPRTMSADWKEQDQLRPLHYESGLKAP